MISLFAPNTLAVRLTANTLGSYVHEHKRSPLSVLEPVFKLLLLLHEHTWSDIRYNWLEDCGKSSERLEQRILDIIAFWTKAKRRCDKVILVTHSMGGLVARACAKRIPEKVAGVIHGVMPALGAPAAYRRIACGTESSSPDNSHLENLEASVLAKILGETTEKTTAVLATSPGALELLPNHLYPGPWLHVRVNVCRKTPFYR